MALNAADFLVIVAYLTAVTLFGLRFRRRQTSLKDYFLADRSIPWWAISLSIVAAETSTLTIISVPGLAYQSDFRFLQFVFGYILGRIVIALMLIPPYFRGDLITAYQLIDRRFGRRLRTLTAGLFLVTRAAAEGVRVFAVAMVVRIALASFLSGMSDFGRDVAAIGIVTVLTLIYTFEGGMVAVIWTDVVQLGMYFAGAFAAVLVIDRSVPGGWRAIHAIAASAGKFRILDWSWNLSSIYTFWSGIIGGTLFTMASHGTDQLIVQRLLAARNRRHAQLAIIASGFAVFVQFALFLLIGAMLFALYVSSPHAESFARTDTVFPTFIATRMPHVLSGFMIAAILAAAMSNLSAALNSLSSTAIVDFYAHMAPHATEQRRVRLSRIATVGWALLLFALALLARHGGKVLEMGLSIASVAYGSLLGVFLLAVLFGKASERGAMAGMICGFIFNLCLWRFTGVPFTWYVCFGSLATLLIGLGASRLMPDARPVRDRI